MRNAQNRGFTLIELSIVLLIIGLIFAALLSGYTVYVQNSTVATTQRNIEDVNKAISTFTKENGFMPCPANPTDPAAVATDCSAPATATAPMLRLDTGIDRTTLPPGNQRLIARIGVVPVTARDKNGELRQLVPGSKAVDGWRRRLTYVVIEQSAVAATYPLFNAGGIDIRDITNPAVSIDGTARYVVISHGPDGAGAYTASGVLHQPCNTANVDGENCDPDTRFLSIGMSGIRSTTGDANNYDDFVLNDTRSVTSSSCPPSEFVVGIDTDGTVMCERVDVELQLVTQEITQACCGLQNVVAFCPPGKKVVGGGCNNEGSTSEVLWDAGHPLPGMDGWQCNTLPVTATSNILRAYALCAITE